MSVLLIFFFLNQLWELLWEIELHCNAGLTALRIDAIQNASFSEMR